MASDDTKRWCPVHGLHDDWTRNAPLCNRQREDCYGHCNFAPIATDVVATIEQRGYERGLADGAARERAAERIAAWHRREASMLREFARAWVLEGLPNEARQMRAMANEHDAAAFRIKRGDWKEE